MNRTILTLSLIFVFLSPSLVQSQEKKWMPLNLAHRGLSFLAPENTLIAFKMAAAVGADGTECDVYLSKDGIPVLSHDRNVKRTMGVDADITSKTFEEIRRLDAGVWKGKHFAGEVPPTLEEYLLVLKDSPCRPIVEIKQEGIEKEVIDVIRKTGMVEKTIIVCFVDKTLATVRQIEPKLQVGLIRGGGKFKGDPESYAEELAQELMDRASKIDTDVVSLQHGLISEKLVKILHDKGYYVWAWTINDVPRMHTLLDWGLDSVTSDRSDVLAEVIKERTTKKSIFSK